MPNLTKPADVVAAFLKRGTRIEWTFEGWTTVVYELNDEYLLYDCFCVFDEI